MHSGRSARWGHRARWALAGAILFGVAACTDFPPTQTENPLNVPSERKDIVSVCYDDSDHGRSEIETVALAACGKNTAKVTPWRVDKLLNDCPVFKKSRASFLCVPIAR